MNKRQLKELDRTGRSALKLHILGAAKSVTGSLFLYEYFEKEKVTRFLVDAGAAGRGRRRRGREPPP